MIHWLGHASVRLDGSKIIYIDPWEIKGGPKADIILVTHSHYDHLSPDDIKKISGPETQIVATADCVSKLRGKIKSLKPGETFEYAGVTIQAVPAYNPSKQFHPKGSNWVGYIVTLDGKKIYHAGDTDKIPEMKEINVDVALLPIGGTYTMTAAEAASACDWLKAKEVIPMHFGKIVGGANDAEEFKKLCKIPVKVLPKE